MTASVWIKTVSRVSNREHESHIKNVFYLAPKIHFRDMQCVFFAISNLCSITKQSVKAVFPPHLL